MVKRSFLEVPELHEDHVTLVLQCSYPGGEITATFIGPYEPHENVYQSEPMPIEQAIEAALLRAKLKGCNVVVKDFHNLWNPADGELI